MALQAIHVKALGFSHSKPMGLARHQDLLSNAFSAGWGRFHQSSPGEA